MGGVDEHFVVCHLIVSFARRRGGPPDPASEPATASGIVVARALVRCVIGKVRLESRARASPGTREAGCRPHRVCSDPEASGCGVRSFGMILMGPVCSRASEA
jgi:hypothetical protein